MNRSIVHLILCTIAAWALSFNAASAADVSAAFDAANQLYEQGKFAEAVAAYEKAIESGTASPALYFNLGNAHFKSGEVGRAMVAYRKAERLAPRDPDIRANIQFVRNQIQGPMILPSRWQQWVGKLTINEWAVLVAVAFWLSLLLLVAIQFKPALKKSLGNLAWLGGLLTVVLGICFVTLLNAYSTKTVIVTARDASVRNGPFDESPNAFTAHDGAELRVLDQKDNWIQVTAANRIGWLRKDQATSLQP